MKRFNTIETNSLKSKLKEEMISSFTPKKEAFDNVIFKDHGNKIEECYFRYFQKNPTIDSSAFANMKDFKFSNFLKKNTRDKTFNDRVCHLMSTKYSKLS